MNCVTRRRYWQQFIVHCRRSMARLQIEQHPNEQDNRGSNERQLQNARGRRWLVLPARRPSRTVFFVGCAHTRTCALVFRRQTIFPVQFASAMLGRASTQVNAL